MEVGASIDKGKGFSSGLKSMGQHWGHVSVLAVWADLKVTEPFDSRAFLAHSWLLSKSKASILQDYCWGIRLLYSGLSASALPRASQAPVCR